jgi:hypothetical protein
MMSSHSDLFVASGTSPTSSPDFICSGYGSFYLLRPSNQTARLWIETHIHPEDRAFVDNVVIERRLDRSILMARLDDGLEVAR